MKQKLNYKAGDVVVCHHQYRGHYGDLGIVISSHSPGVGFDEYVTVRFDYGAGCGGSCAFLGSDHPDSLEVVDSMPDLAGLTPTQIHEVLVKEAEKVKEDEKEERIRANLHEFNKQSQLNGDRLARERADNIARERADPIAKASRRIVGELIDLPEYRFVNPSLVATVVRETVSRYIELERKQPD